MRRFKAVEREVLYHLNTPEDGRPLWAVDDLNREMERTDAIDDLNGLHRAGLIGEFLHDLSSSLHHLAWQLVLRNGGQPTEGTGFLRCH